MHVVTEPALIARLSDRTCAYFMNKLRSNSTSQYILDKALAGDNSPYVADANEPDDRYKSYGVRAKGKKEIISKHKKDIRDLSQSQQIKLATKLIQSRYGEEQSVALFILENISNYYSPKNFYELDVLIRCIHGWSKVDSYSGTLLRDILFNHPVNFIQLVKQWNQDDDRWLKRFSVVLFTRKVADSGQFTSIGLDMCDRLLFDNEPLVLKGVVWALKDLMKTEKKLILDYIKGLRKKGVSSLVTLYAIKDLKEEERNEVLSIKKKRL